jgi:hypothetical protein
LSLHHWTTSSQCNHLLQSCTCACSLDAVFDHAENHLLGARIQQQILVPSELGIECLDSCHAICRIFLKITGVEAVVILHQARVIDAAAADGGMYTDAAVGLLEHDAENEARVEFRIA